MRHIVSLTTKEREITFLKSVFSIFPLSLNSFEELYSDLCKIVGTDFTTKICINGGTGGLSLVPVQFLSNDLTPTVF